MVTNTSLLGS